MRVPRRLLAETGSVTAELALALPTVSLLIAITLSSFGLQLERLKLVDLAASVSRAVARGEPVSQSQSFIDQWYPGVRLKISATADLLCATASVNATVMGLRGFDLRLAERQCARKQGL
jgi:hypothetical protein